MIAGILQVLYNFYNVLFQPILSLGPYLALGFFSACLAALFSGIRWWLLDHEKADKIQEKISDKQEKMKKARENDNPEKASKFTKEVFKHNQEFMMLNMKPMLGTMVFVALIFPWLGASFAPTVQLNQANGQIYEGNFTYANTETPITVENTSGAALLKVDNQSVEPGQQATIKDFKWTYKGIKDKTPGFFSNTEGKVASFNGHFVPLPFSLPFIGGALNWLGFYIIIAMPMTLILNKALGIQ